MVDCRRVQGCLPRPRRYTVVLPALDHTNVHLRQEGEDVDRQEEFDGEVLDDVGLRCYDR